MAASKNTKIKHLKDEKILLFSYISRNQNNNMKSYKHTHVNCSEIYNIEDMETSERQKRS